MHGSGRHLVLDGADNFRDLGGLPAADGRRVRPGLVYRSDTLQELTPGDVDLLVGRLGLTTIVDLRGPEEIEIEGRGLLAKAPVAWLNLPIGAAGFDASTAKPDVPGYDLTGFYHACLAGSVPSVLRLLELLADPGAHPVVFHCAAGKDRTGLAAAVTLGCLGVADEVVVADYEATNQRMDRVLERLRRLPTQQPLLQLLPREAYDAEAGTMREFLAGMAERHGGTRSWALACGLTEERLAALQDALLEGFVAGRPEWATPS